MSEDVQLLRRHLAVHVGDGRRAIRFADFVRHWRLFGEEPVWVDAVAESRRWTAWQVKGNCVHTGLPIALDEVEAEATPRELRRARIITRTLYWARRSLRADAEELLLACDLDEAIHGRPPDAGGEERRLTLEAERYLAALDETIGQSGDREAVREAFLVHGCATLAEAAHFLAETRGWKLPRAYGVVERWRERALRKVV